MARPFFDSSPSEEESLGKFFALAAGIHVSLVAAGLILGAIFDFQWFQSENKELEILQSAVRVDVVGMPKMTVQELKKIEPQAPADSQKVEEAPKSAPQAISKSEVEFKKKEDKKEKKIELSSLLSNLSSKKVDHAKKKKSDGLGLSQKELASLMMEGNKVSKGQALVGDSLKAAQSAFHDYVSAIPSHIRPHWRLPSYLLQKDLRARIRVYISENGKILKADVFESSGVKEFDERALAALEKSGALPAPDRAIWGRLAAGDVILGFPL